MGADKKPLSDAAVLKGLNAYGKNGSVAKTSNFYGDSTSGKYGYDSKTKSWYIKSGSSSGTGASAGSANPQSALATLNKFASDGNVSKNSSYYQAVQAGIYKYDNKTKSWYINAGSGTGASAGSANPQSALATLNKFAPDGNVSKNSSYYDAVQAGIYQYDNKTKSWYINTAGTGSKAATQRYTGSSIIGYTGSLPTGTGTITNADQQTIRNMNRMYGNGKIPLNSDYASLVASGQVVWDDTNHAWMATSGPAKGYIGVGQATQQDIRNLNRLFPGGQNVTVGTRYADLIASGNVAWDPNSNSWVATSGKAVGYTGTGSSAPYYVGTSSDGSQYITSGNAPVSGGSGYIQPLTTDMTGQGGYDTSGMSQGGYDTSGMSQGGYDTSGMSQGGYDTSGMSQGGYDMSGSQGGYDMSQGGYDMSGLYQGY